jgi:hypothetical protein
VTVSQNTNCRAGPGQPYTSLGVLTIGQKAKLVGKSVDGEYWIIENPNGRGTCWLWGNYATVEGDPSRLPVMTPPPPPPPTATFTPPPPTATLKPSPTSTLAPTATATHPATLAPTPTGSILGTVIAPSKFRPAAPGNLAYRFFCKVIGTDVLSLTWTDNAANEIGYRVYRDGVLVQTLGANSTSYQEIVSSVFSAVYGVEAYNGFGASDRPTIQVINKCR